MQKWFHSSTALHEEGEDHEGGPRLHEGTVGWAQHCAVCKGLYLACILVLAEEQVSSITFL